MSDRAQKSVARGDRRMRELGLVKVSFWLDKAELALVKNAIGRHAARPGRKARDLLLAWAANHQVDVQALARRAKEELR